MLFFIEIWEIIKDYMGIGNMLGRLRPLTIKQLKNLTYFTFMYPDTIPSFCPITTNKSDFIAILLKLESSGDTKKIELIKRLIKEHSHDLQNMKTHKDQLEMMHKAYSIKKSIEA